MRYRIFDLDIKEISFVEKPANRRKYLFIKDEGGGHKMDPVKLENLTYEDRRSLEKEVEAKLLPDLKKQVEEQCKTEFEKNYDQEKVELIKDELRPEIEKEIREEFGKQDVGVSKDAANAITAALKDIVKGVTSLSKVVGYGYKSKLQDDQKVEELEKTIEELKSNIMTLDDFKELVEAKQ
jgi:hypothetical protein